jgi:hypothetical protein
MDGAMQKPPRTRTRSNENAGPGAQKRRLIAGDDIVRDEGVSIPEVARIPKLWEKAGRPLRGRCTGRCSGSAFGMGPCEWAFPFLDRPGVMVHHCITMRTTVDLPEEVHAAALAVARQEGISLGDVLARAWRLAARPARRARVRNGILVLDGGEGITPDSVRDALAEDGC